jgi:hypothetical protein
LAEPFASKTNLDIGVGVNILDESVEACETAPCSINKAFGSCVRHTVGISKKSLFVDIFKADSDCPNNSDNQRSESQTTKVVSKDPEETLAKTEVSSLIRS